MVKVKRLRFHAPLKTLRPGRTDHRPANEGSANTSRASAAGSDHDHQRPGLWTETIYEPGVCARDLIRIGEARVHVAYDAPGGFLGAGGRRSRTRCRRPLRNWPKPGRYEVVAFSGVCAGSHFAVDMAGPKPFQRERQGCRAIATGLRDFLDIKMGWPFIPPT